MTNILSREKRLSAGIEGGLVYILRDNAGNDVYAVMEDPENKPEAAVLVRRDNGRQIVLDLHCRGTEWTYEDGRWSVLEQLITEAANPNLERHYLVQLVEWDAESPLGASTDEHIALECEAYTTHRRYSWEWSRDVSAEANECTSWQELAEYLGLVPEYTVPIFLYDHGAQQFATRRDGGGTVGSWWQHWQWDAGQIGFLSATQQQVHEWANNRHAVLFAEESIVTGCTAEDVREELTRQVRRLNDYENGWVYRVGLGLVEMEEGVPVGFLGWVMPDQGGGFSFSDLRYGVGEVNEVLDRIGAVERVALFVNEIDEVVEW